MTDILVRNVDPEVRRRLKARAAEKGTSLSAEINAILANAVEAAGHPGGRISSWFSNVPVEDRLTPEEQALFDDALDRRKWEWNRTSSFDEET